MRTKLFTIAIAILCIFSAQSNAQCVGQGNMTLDLYYGLSLTASVMKGALVTETEGVTYKYNNLGPVGFRFEYMLADKIGVGVDANYHTLGVNYDESSGTTTYNYKFTMNTIRAMVRFNFHYLSSESLNMYVGCGIGYRNRTYNYTSTNPDYESNSTEGLIPVAFRISNGLRYYFTDNIGIGVDVGIGGGAFATGGISIKL